MSDKDLVDNYIKNNTVPTVFIEPSPHIIDNTALTFLGGWPMARKSFKWPGDTGDWGQYAHSFVAQINLSDLPFRPNDIPKDGILYFFIDPNGLENTPEACFQDDLEAAKEKGGAEQIKSAQENFDRQPRTVCVVYGPKPAKPKEIRPTKSQPMPNRKNLYHHGYDKKELPDLEKDAYRKVAVALVKGDTCVWPEYPLPEGLPSRLYDDLAKLENIGRRKAYANYFGNDRAQEAFGSFEERVPITTILTDLSAEVIKHPFDVDQKTDTLFRDLDNSFYDLDEIVAKHWPQSWNMVTDYVDDLFQRYHDNEERASQIGGIKQPPKTQLGIEIENWFLEQLEEFRTLAGKHKSTDIVSEKDRQTIRQKISKMHKKIRSEWHTIAKQCHQQSFRSPKGEFLARIRKAYNSYRKKGKLDFSSNTDTQVDVVKRARLFQETANRQRGSVIAAIEISLKIFMRSYHPTVKDYISRQNKENGLPENAPLIKQAMKANSKPHQMFGYGAEVQGALAKRYKEGYIMLLQLENDNQMGFGTADGNLQIWISPQNARAGKWHLAEWNFDVT